MENKIVREDPIFSKDNIKLGFIFGSIACSFAGITLSLIPKIMDLVTRFKKDK